MSKYVRTHVHPHDKVEAEGYATFNGFEHLCVDVPDGGFTISAKTSEGKRITFSFLPYKSGGPAQCVDICYHDGKRGTTANDAECPVFDVICFGETNGSKAQRFQYDSREKGNHPTGIVCVLMDKEIGSAS